MNEVNDLKEQHMVAGTGKVPSTQLSKSGQLASSNMFNEELLSQETETEVTPVAEWVKVKDNIYKRQVGSKQYEFKYRVKQIDGIGQMVDTWKKLDDKRQPFRTLRETEAHRKAFIEDIMNRTERSVNVPNLHTLQEIWDDYVEKRGALLAPNTLNKHISNMNIHIVPYFNKRNIESISVGDVKNFIIGLRKKLAYESARGVYSTLAKIWKYAYELSIIPRDTYIEIFVDTVTRVRIPKTINGSTSKTILPETFSSEQREQFFSLAKAEGEEYYILLCLCYYGGMRISEALGLFWDNVDLKSNKITVSQQLVYDKRTHETFVDNTKTKSVRVFTMPPALSAILTEWKKEQAIPQEKIDLPKTACSSVPDHIANKVATYKQFVVSKPAGVILTHSQSNHMRERIQKKTGEHFYYHALRHTLVTNLASQGVPIKNISHYIGHADTRTTEKYYLGIDEVGESILNSILEKL